MSGNINLSDGFKEVTINNDPNRVIRINPSDIGLIKRFEEASPKIEALIEKYGEVKEELPMEEIAKITSEIDAEARKQLDYIVGAPVSDTAFGTANCLSLAGGQTIFENFLEAYVSYMEPVVKAEYKKSRQRVSKYTSQAKRIKK